MESGGGVKGTSRWIRYWEGKVAQLARAATAQ